MTNREIRRRMAQLMLGTVVALLSACQGISIDGAADGKHLVAGSIEGAAFPQRFLQRRKAGHSRTLRVYFGGDGRPWVDGEISSDPTGRRQLGLRLFLADTSADVYLGRPCYHVDEKAASACEPTLWTSARYGPAVVQSMSSALAQLRERHGAGAVELVGFSGGGTLALLVAARDASVTRVVTVAPLLDIDAWTAHHRLVPLRTSLSPLDSAGVHEFDELHLIGGRDEIVPPELAGRYAARRPHAQFRVFDDFDHGCCWLKHWPELLETPVAER